jgi:hypothetical protein
VSISPAQAVKKSLTPRSRRGVRHHDLAVETVDNERLFKQRDAEGPLGRRSRQRNRGTRYLK